VRKLRRGLVESQFHANLPSRRNIAYEPTTLVKLINRDDHRPNSYLRSWRLIVCRQ